LGRVLAEVNLTPLFREFGIGQEAVALKFDEQIHKKLGSALSD